jgi:hypothetical protein
MSLATDIQLQLLASLSGDSDDLNMTLYNSLRLLSKWRSLLIQNTLLAREGTIVLRGPFAGLEFVERSSEGCHIAKLLGCYEQPLHPCIETILSIGYSKILNIGCAEGYYAVGFAKAMPSLISLAFDTSKKAQEACRQLAEMNGVSDRVKIGSLFSPIDFAKYENENVLVFCDIEGGEEELLDPSLAPALYKLDIVVESHECLRPGITKKLISRFDLTHSIEVIEDSGSRQLDDLPDWFKQLAHLDQLLATWEWRSGPTPWLVMRSKNNRN